MNAKIPEKNSSNGASSIVTVFLLQKTWLNGVLHITKVVVKSQAVSSLIIRHQLFIIFLKYYITLNIHSRSGTTHCPLDSSKAARCSITPQSEGYMPAETIHGIG